MRKELKEQFDKLIYNRGLADFEFDNSYDQCVYLRRNGFNDDDLKELGYGDDDIADSLEAYKKVYDNN